MARANTDHAQTLIASLQREPLSTRELHTWYQHYQKANRSKRGRMLAQPRLFCQALQAHAREQADKALRAGPEGAWLAELKRIIERLHWLGRQTPLVCERAFPTIIDKSQQFFRGVTCDSECPPL
ncbi:MAG: DUF2336 domain-containing protein [Sulfitobacter sp.]|nr:DUF2336 domain-containing protein [Sulfitobacter sp.]